MSAEHEVRKASTPMTSQDVETIAGFLIADFESEMRTTLSVFASVPTDHLDYQPDPQSKTGLGLLRHIVLEDEWFLNCIANGAFTPPPDGSDVCGIMSPAGHEREMLAWLAGGRDARAVLGSEARPALDGVTWVDVAHHFRACIDGTACGDALAWFGDMLLALEGQERAARGRPWKVSFDRAEARATTVRAVSDVLGDWIADEVWGLAWTEHGSFALARAELATRLDVASAVTTTLVASGVRADRAAAEAVLVAELAGESSLWARIVRQMRID